LIPPLVYIAEDDPEIRALMVGLFRAEGWRAEAAPDARAFWSLVEDQRPDLALLDVMMPGEDGLALCRRLQAAYGCPVIIASARGEAMDRIIGLEVGADAYLAKPFHPRELIAQAKAVLRARQGGSARAVRPVFRFEGWRLDVGARDLTDPAGQAVILTAGEHDLLMALLERPRQVLSRDLIMDVLRGRSADPYDRSIDIQISRLRRKLGDDPAAPRLVKTVRNGGYLFAAEVVAE
jgi:two-component system OmpR family response regulator